MSIKKDPRDRKSLLGMMIPIEAQFGSSTVCSAKWLQSTTNLYNGTTHSCHHCPRHSIDVNTLLDNPSGLHNTPEKVRQREQMLNNERPPECSYCWDVEDQGGLSDRIIKTTNTEWSIDYIEELKNLNPDPTYLEIAFDTTCNLKCVYCGPAVSSKWYDEIMRNGSFGTSRNYNSIGAVKVSSSLPIPANQYNPFKEAFWTWWPQVKHKLANFRITGGEPLLSKDLWRILDDLINEPVPDLILVINTNLAVDDKLIDRLIEKITLLEGKLKKIQIATSAEAHGKQCEFIRHGLQYDQFIDNHHRLLSATRQTRILITMSVNTLGLFTLTDFLEDYRRLRDTWGNRIMPSMPHVSYPAFLSINTVDHTLLDPVFERLEQWSTDYATPIEKELIDRLKAYGYQTRADYVEQQQDLLIFLDEWVERHPGNPWEPLFPALARYYKRG